MEGTSNVDALGWRTARQLLAGIGQGLLGFFLLVLSVCPPFVNWLQSSALGEGSPARDLLAGSLRAYWGTVILFGVGALIQVRLIAVTILRFLRDRPWENPLERQLKDELISLACLSGYTSDRRRAEVKKQLDQCSAIAAGRMMGLFILIALPALVLVFDYTILFAGGAASAPIAPHRHIPALLAELEQVEEGELEQAEVWIHPETDAARLPGAWGSSYRAYAHRYHIISAEPGSQWVEVLVPDALDFSPDTERPFREGQSIPWNLENAQRYQVRYTSDFHLVTEIIPLP